MSTCGSLHTDICLVASRCSLHDEQYLHMRHRLYVQLIKPWTVYKQGRIQYTPYKVAKMKVYYLICTIIFATLYFKLRLKVSFSMTYQASSFVSSSGSVNSSRHCCREGSPSPGVTSVAEQGSTTWSCVCGVWGGWCVCVGGVCVCVWVVCVCVGGGKINLLWNVFYCLSTVCIRSLHKGILTGNYFYGHFLVYAILEHRLSIQ